MLIFTVPALSVVGLSCGVIWAKYKGGTTSKIEVKDATLPDDFKKCISNPNVTDNEVKSIASRLQKVGELDKANQLLKRHKLRSVSPDVQQKRRKAVKNALKSTDKNKVLDLARALEQEGAIASAKFLEEYAEGLS